MGVGAAIVVVAEDVVVVAVAGVVVVAVVGVVVDAARAQVEGRAGVAVMILYGFHRSIWVE